MGWGCVGAGGASGVLLRTDAFGRLSAAAHLGQGLRRLRAQT